MSALDLEIALRVRAAGDLPGAHVGLVALDADDDVQGLGIEREVDVGLRRDGVRPRMRVVDRAEVEPGVLDLCLDPVLLHAVDLVAERAGGGVRRAVHGDGLAVAGGDHAAALVRRLGARVGDDLVEELTGYAHGGADGSSPPDTALRGRGARTWTACCGAA